MIRIRKTVITCIYLLAALVWTSAAWAAEKNEESTTEIYQLETIEVTAERRAENLQEVPASVTAFTESQIEDADIHSMAELARATPNLQWFDYGSRLHQFSAIRGMVTMPSQEPAMGFYVDDVAYLDSMSFNYPLFGIERIEVLRGPQGTLYGRNTLGGAINIVTRTPDNDYQGEVTVGYGNYNQVNVNAGVRGPVVTDKLFLGIGGFYETRDGFYDNDFLDSEDDGRDGKGFRSVIQWTPTDRLDLSLTIQAQKHEDSAYINGLQGVDRPFHYRHNQEGKHESDMWSPTLCLKYDGDFFKLTSITGWRDQDVDEIYDIDLTPKDMWYGTYGRYVEAFTQELRIASPDDDSILKWIAGAYYFNKNDTEFNVMTTLPDVPDTTIPWDVFRSADRDREGFAFFGQASCQLFKKLDLTFGLRYDSETMDAKIRKDMVTPSGTGSRTPMHDPYDISNDSTAWLPKFSVAYCWTPDLMTYATVAKGYRAGGFNSMAPTDDKRAFDSEFSWNYELGLKSQWFDNRLIFNPALFYIKVSDEQVKVHQGNYGVHMENAGESYRMGAEVEIKARPVRGLDLIAGASFLEAKYDEYNGGKADYKDKHIAQAPESTCNLAVQLRRPAWGKFDLFSRIDYYYNSKVFFNTDNTMEEDPYQLVNLRVGLESEHFDVHFWLKNAFDEEYLVHIYPSMLGNADEYAAPRTFGVSITTRF